MTWAYNDVCLVAVFVCRYAFWLAGNYLSLLESQIIFLVLGMGGWGACWFALAWLLAGVGRHSG